MNSRERVQALFSGDRMDRSPIDLGATYSSGIHLLAYQDLRKALGLPPCRIRCNDVMQQLAEVDDDVLHALHCDFKQISPTTVIDTWEFHDLFPGHEFYYPGPLTLREEEDRHVLIDEAGNRYVKPHGAFYFDAEDINTWYGTPFVPTGERLRELRERTRKIYEADDFALVANFGGGFMSMAPDFLMDMLLEPEKVMAELESRCTDLIDLYRRIYGAVGEYTCAVALYSDFGTQNGPALSPETFRSVIKPHFKRFCDWVHGETHWKVFLHSCGGIEPLIEDIIDMGIDILNPIQTSAAGMDLHHLKQTFGSRIVFWGGACDTQRILGKVHGEALIRHVRERIQILEPGGNFVFNPVHDIQPDVSGEDIAAIYREMSR